MMARNNEDTPIVCWSVNPNEASERMNVQETLTGLK
jgi:hypothetical protein